MPSGGARPGAGRKPIIKSKFLKLSEHTLDSNTEEAWISIGPTLIYKIKELIEKDADSLSKNEIKALPFYTKMLEFFRTKHVLPAAAPNPMFPSLNIKLDGDGVEVS